MSLLANISEGRASLCATHPPAKEQGEKTSWDEQVEDRGNAWMSKINKGKAEST